MTRRDSDFKVRCLVEMHASNMAYLRDGAAKAMSCSEQTMCSEHMFEVIEMSKMTKVVGVRGVGVKFLSKVEVAKLVVKSLEYPADMLGVPKAWFPEVEEQLPGFNDK